MRFTKAESLLRLAIWLQTSHVGVGLRDIEEEFGVSRRTAERMRDAISRLLPDLVELKSYDGKKRWRIPKTKTLLPIHIDAEDLNTLEVACQILEREHLSDHSFRLKDIERKIRALDDGQRSIGREVDLEALLEAEGFAMRLGPRPDIDPDILNILRTAILKCEKVTLHYRGQGTGQISRQRVCPYGFLYGNQHYLVAYSTNPGVKDYRLFRLANIRKVVALEEYYERRDDFSLQQYAERSFGIFQGKKYDVELIFLKRSAADAQTFKFHPSQKLSVLKDGRLRVEMRASGLRELAWHLITWGTEVKVIKPERLKEMLMPIRDVVANNKSWKERDQ